MRNIAGIPGIVKEVDSNFPYGAIINETPSNPGTPVVREIYNDVLVNLYKLLAITGNPANGVEDSEATTYQLLAAFQKLCNTQNDIEQQLSIVGAVASIGLAIDLLPNKYFIIAKASGTYVSTTTYTFKGSGATPTYPFSSPTGFNDGDELLLILNQSGVKAYGITAVTSPAYSGVEYTMFGTPLAFNNSNKIWYESEGIIFNDDPAVYDLQSLLRTSTSLSLLVVYEIFIIGNYILCLTFDPATNNYKFYRFDLTNLATAPVAMTMSGPAFPVNPSYDDQPYCFTDGITLYITNGSDATTDNFAVNKYSMNLAAGTISGSGSVSLNSQFKKSTNSVVFGNYLYTFVGGTIEQYNLNTGTYTYGKAFPGYIGVLFNYKGNIFYSAGDVAKKWTLPVYS